VLGRFLFRWRGVIGVIAFGIVFWLARPTFGSCLLGVPFLLAGLAVRFWASGYIGIEGRVREIGASRRIVGGPYRVLRHPLYIGNFLLVVGMLVALRPAWWMASVVLAGFVVEYVVIVAAEEKDLAGRRIQNPESRVQNPEVWTDRQSPESMHEKQGTVNGENGGQFRGDTSTERREERVAEVSPALASDVLGAPWERAARYSPRFPRPCEGTVPVFRQRPESFLLSRALVEWRTWVVTGVGWGLAMVKALV
jgi:hypothetical protein